jgi:parallel beta-helix repeat protein
VLIRIPTGRNNTISGNFIGTDPTGQINLGNGAHGVSFDFGAQKNTIGPGNVIAFNGNHGVSMNHDSSLFNTITRNTITKNEGLGISLTDGGNAAISAPVITAATRTLVRGTAVPNSIVDIFSDSLEEGAIYEGTVTADPSGQFVWSGSASGPHVTATCTDTAGNTSMFSNYSLVTGVDEYAPRGVPAEHTLGQNFPNPFNPSTTIRYGLPNRSHVTLVVFNTLAQEVGVIVSGDQEAGYHEVKFDGSGLSSGVYFYRLRAGEFMETKRLILAK